MLAASQSKRLDTILGKLAWHVLFGAKSTSEPNHRFIYCHILRGVVVGPEIVEEFVRDVVLCLLSLAHPLHGASSRSGGTYPWPSRGFSNFYSTEMSRQNTYQLLITRKVVFDTV